MVDHTHTLAQDTAAIVLAAGKGTRMKSDLPKVLHKVCGTPMLERILRIIDQTEVKSQCLVLSDETSAFESLVVRRPNISVAIQHLSLGTGDAVAAASSAFEAEELPAYTSATHYTGPKLTHNYILICAGDTPALDPRILRNFMEQCLSSGQPLGVIGMVHPEPGGYGRLVLDDQQRLAKIIEEKDADAQIKAIHLVNSGVIFAERRYLFELLKKIKNDNAQKEYYLTDCFALAAKAGQAAFVYQTKNYQSFAGVNQRSQLAAVETWLMAQRREELMADGVSFHLPESCYLEDQVMIGADSEIGPHCSFTGSTIIGRRTQIGSHCCLHNVELADGEILAPGTLMINDQ